MSRLETDPRSREDRAPVGQEEALLEVEGLTTVFPTSRGLAVAVNNVCLRLAVGETKGIVGESGSGKSMLCRSIVGLVPRPGATVAGSVRWRGRELIGLRERDLRAVRGKEISMIFQDPTSALNPVFTVGEQIAETLRVHLGLGRRAARREAIELLARVGIPSARERYEAYPHELSGGMRQRAMIAIAVSCHPSLILADEPTTNLDVTVQDQILHLLAQLQAEYGMAMLLISHDLGVVAQNADSVVVMYAGHVVEEAPTSHLFSATKHPYTAGLIRALPSLSAGGERQPLVPISGQPPDLDALPPGCPFQPRCAHVRAACAEVTMEHAPVGPGHSSACPFHGGEPRE